MVFTVSNSLCVDKIILFRPRAKYVFNIKYNIDSSDIFFEDKSNLIEIKYNLNSRYINN